MQERSTVAVGKRGGGCCGKKRGRGHKEQERAREKGNGCGRAAARAELARMLDNRDSSGSTLNISATTVGSYNALAAIAKGLTQRCPFAALRSASGTGAHVVVVVCGVCVCGLSTADPVFFQNRLAVILFEPAPTNFFLVSAFFQRNMTCDHYANGTVLFIIITEFRFCWVSSRCRRLVHSAAAGVPVCVAQGNKNIHEGSQQPPPPLVTSG